MRDKWCVRDGRIEPRPTWSSRKTNKPRKTLKQKKKKKKKKKTHLLKMAKMIKFFVKFILEKKATSLSIYYLLNVIA